VACRVGVAQRLASADPPAAVTTSLLHRVAARDAAAIRECLDRYGALVWSLARRMSPSPTEAEDAVQEIFLDLWQSAGRFDPGIATEAGFVAMIARRRLIDRHRRRQRRWDTEPLPEVLSEPQGQGGPRQEVCAEAALAARAMEQLRPEQRAVLVLSCQGMSHEEIATAMGMPLGTVKAHVRRGLSRVRQALVGSPSPLVPEDPS
jgi:RNA polymerase sigma factor (sigma-70 family)